MGTHFFKQKVLRTSNVTGWKDTPLPAAWRETPANASNVLDEEAFDQYLSVVGMLNWLAVKTRPDIRFAVTRLQHRLANPTFDDPQLALINNYAFLDGSPLGDPYHNLQSINQSIQVQLTCCGLTSCV